MNKIDKILKTFTKAVAALDTEAVRLNNLAVQNDARALELSVSANAARKEQARAERIASNLEKILNG